MNHEFFIPKRPARRRAAWIGLALAIASIATATAVAITEPAQQNQPRAASPLDRLRDDAALGNTEASRFLLRQLLDNYDRGRDEAVLYEAAMWFDRDWSTPEYLSSGLSARLIARQCNHPVLRWHWLCALGE